MIKTEEVVITQTYNKHHFYCDQCGEYIGSSNECDDGYYQKLGELGIKIHVVGTWYRINKTLCVKCQEEFIKNLRTGIESLGFER